jgi:hypothetical protein
VDAVVHNLTVIGDTAKPVPSDITSRRRNPPGGKWSISGTSQSKILGILALMHLALPGSWDQRLQKSDWWLLGSMARVAWLPRSPQSLDLEAVFRFRGARAKQTIRHSFVGSRSSSWTADIITLFCCYSGDEASSFQTFVLIPDVIRYLPSDVK